MEIESDRVVSVTEPTGIIIIVHREQDGHYEKACIFNYDTDCDPWGPSGFVLLQHTTADGLKRLQSPDLCDPSPRTLKLTKWTGTVYEISSWPKFPCEYRPSNSLLGPLGPWREI